MLKGLRRKIIGDLRVNRGQFLAVWFVVMLGTAFYGAMYPSGTNMINSFYKTYDELNYLDFQVQFDPTSQEAVKLAWQTEGVEAVEGRLVEDAGLRLSPNDRYLINLRLISVPDNAEPTVNKSDLVEGNPIRQPHEVLLLKSFADFHEFEVGDTLNVVIDGVEHQFRIAGLVFNAEYLVAGRSSSSPFPTPSTFGVAWLWYTPLADITQQTGLINEVLIHLEGESRNPDEAREARVRQQLTDLYSGFNNVTVYSRTQTASGGISEALLNGNRPIMIFFSGLFLVGSTVITSILLGRVVQSERQRIGTLRAMGVTRRELIQHYLMYGLLIGVSGGLVGTIVGYLNSFWVMAVFIKYIAGGTLPAFTNTPQVPFLLLGFAVAVIGSTLAGVYPAWVESATSPGVALRPVAPKKPNKLSQMRLLFLPMALRQALRNLFRVPGRSISTALGVILGAMMIFSAFSMWDTTERGFADYFDSMAYDLRIDMRSDLPSLQSAESLESQVSQLDGVESVQAGLVGAITVENEAGDGFDTFAIALDERDPYIKPATLEGEAAFSSGDGVWIGHNLARELSLSVGDTITIVALGQTNTTTIKGIVSQVVGAPVYMPRTLVESWMPGGVFLTNTAFVRVKAGKADQVRNEAVGLPKMVAVEVIDEYKGDLNTYLEFFRVGTIVFGLFGYMLTFALLFNTVNASIRERQGELAVLRALGTNAREITIIVLLELLVMVVIGAVIGIPSGQQMGFYLVGFYDTDVYGNVNTATWLSLLLGLGSLLGIVFLAALPGLRAVQKVDLGAVSKSQSF